MTNWGNLFQLSQPAKLADTTDYVTNLVQAVAANTKGSYVEIDASTPHDSEGLIIEFAGLSYASDNLFDIAIGAISSEIDIISNILISQTASFQISRRFEFPLKIKAGTRISGRSQGISALANNFRISVHLLRGSWSYSRGFAVCDTYGANTGDSGGIVVDPGATPDTKSAWEEISSGISRDIKGFILCIGNRNIATRPSASSYWNVDVGVGAEGSEEIIFPDWMLCTYSGSDLLLPCFTPFIPIHLLSGSRISVRVASDVTDATYRLIDVVIYTFS
jgi:hypothetical protein